LDHVLAIGQADFPHGQIPVAKIDLLPFLRRLDSTLRFDAQEKGVRLTIEIPSGYLEVVSDAGALWQVVLNLASNAVKFSAVGGVRRAAVLVRTYVRADRCLIKIYDNGIGIQRNQLNAIWEPYFRLSDGGSLGAPGLGLGLFLVKRAARALAGHSVSVRSRVGTGTIFTVELPGFARPALSWIDKNNHLLFGCVDANRLSGGYVIGFGGGDCDLQSTCDFIDEWDVVFERCRDIDALQRMLNEDERALDAVLVDWDVHRSDTAEVLVDNIRRCSGAATLLIFMISAGNTDSVNIKQLPFVKILQKPFPPQDLALAILAGVDENRRIEGEV
jgi:anti-sigma regulatory factor (Ser/Thr protein kinase)